MNNKRRLAILQSYGFVDALHGFRIASFNLYRTGASNMAYMRYSDPDEGLAIRKLYDRLHKKLLNVTCQIYNERL